MEEAEEGAAEAVEEGAVEWAEEWAVEAVEEGAVEGEASLYLAAPLQTALPLTQSETRKVQFWELQMASVLPR